MKKVSLFVAALCILALCTTSCVEKSKKYQAVLLERDSLQLANESIINEYDSTIGTINEIENALQSVREAEGIIVVEDLEGPNQNQAVSEIMAIQQTLQQNRQKIADLEKRLSEKGTANASLKATIERLKQQMDEKDAYITELKGELQSKNIKIEELSGQVATMNENIDNLNSVTATQQEMIQNQDVQMNTVYYCIASMSNLKEAGLVTKGGLFKGKEVSVQGIAKELFTQIDKRELKSLPLNTKKATILTQHPEGSYELVKAEDGVLTLEITNIPEFWKVSDYLIISIK